MPPRPLPPSSMSAASLTPLPFITYCSYSYSSLLFSTHLAALNPPCRHLRLIRPVVCRASSTSTSSSSSSAPTLNDLPQSRLNPAPDDYAAPNFADKADLTLYAGHGGNGCVSFQREAFLPDGPPNGGDGGHGGNVYIQAVPGETSLHKLARRRFIHAGRGQHGQGSARSGTRGGDVVISVPVGTIVRELERQDPAAEEAMTFRAWNALQKQRKREQNRQQELQRQRRRQEALDEIPEELGEDLDLELEEEEEEYERGRGSRAGRRRSPRREERDQERVEQEQQEEEEDYDPDTDDPQRRKWLLYPGMSKSETRSAAFPKLPRRTQLYQQPPAPIYLDLSRPSPTPILLAAGGIGGLGNPHFTSRDLPRPVFATRGDDAITLKVSLELKLLADVGLVGLPNAGKSTLLRALTNSRTRVGSWAFTTLQPNIGTVVLDKYSGRPAVKARRLYPADTNSNSNSNPPDDIRTRFTVADIPGLIEGAHLDRGLGIAFLRHVERARVLAFVIDLAAGDAVAALNALWREVGLYARMRDDEERAREIEARVDWDPASDPTRQTVNLMGLGSGPAPDFSPAQPPRSAHIAAKPWFAVATKADLPETQANFRSLKAYVDRLNAGEEPHPCGADGAWTKRCAAIPVSAIKGQGVDRIVHWTVGLLDE